MRVVVSVLMVAAGVAAGWVAATRASGDGPPKLGPQWVRVGDHHERTVVVQATHHGGPSAEYVVPLDYDQVSLYERNDNRGFEFRHPSGDLDVVKDDQGKPRYFCVGLMKVTNIDLDGDGMFDALIDRRGKNGGVPFILCDGRLVRVEDTKNPFSFPPNQEKWVWGVGRQVKYVFQGGAWNAVEAK